MHIFRSLSHQAVYGCSNPFGRMNVCKHHSSRAQNKKTPFRCLNSVSVITRTNRALLFQLVLVHFPELCNLGRDDQRAVTTVECGLLLVVWVLKLLVIVLMVVFSCVIGFEWLNRRYDFPRPNLCFVHFLDDYFDNLFLLSRSNKDR